MTVTLPPDEADAAPARPRPPRGPRVFRAVMVAVIGVAFVWGVSGLDVSWTRLRTAPGDAWEIIRLMWPPDFATEIDRGVLGKVLESVYIAWVGTVIAATVSLPLAFLASNNISPSFVRLPIRQLFNVSRELL